MAKLNHPNIIRLHHAFQDSEKLYFVLEYVPNHDLYEMLHKVSTSVGFSA